MWLRWLAGFLVFPIGIAGLALWQDSHGELVVLGVALPSWWSTLGYFLTFWGAAFAALAVYEVKEISKRYVGRARLPALSRALSTETAILIAKADAPIAELLSDGVLGRLPVRLSAIKSHPSRRSVQTSLGAAKSALKSFKGSINKANNSRSLIVMNIDGFWEIYESLEGLRAELDAFLKDERARQNVQ